MAEERQKQVLERVWVDAGVVVKKENPLGAIFIGVEPIAVRGGVRPALVGGGDKKKANGWEDVEEK